MTASPDLTKALCRGGAAFCAVLAAAISLSGQTANTGAIQGTVLNATSGNFLHNARVTVKGANLDVSTDEHGAYRLPAIPAGTIELTVTFTGLGSQTKIVTVAAGQTVRVDLELALEG
ncbi:MAG: carboxypeptidase-like regulatory domain-containing protein, partial [Opitutus sp.]|nr:carboxypeptidase-like regulatory domain-containing protein [Opitutus sp.]